jgi:hypothetical protein
MSKIQSEVNERWSRQLGNPCHKSAGTDHGPKVRLKERSA